MSWERARNAGYQAATYQAGSNLVTFWTNGVPFWGQAVDYATATGSIACTDDGVSTMSENQIENSSVLDFSCDFGFGF